MKIEELNRLSTAQAFEELFKCCGSTSWANMLVEKRPFLNLEDLMSKSDVCWDLCATSDGLEAFTHHPKIGDVKSLEKKFAATKEWAGNEQAAVSTAQQSTIEALAKGNADYEQKFGFIFIVCATGKSAEEMLALLNERLDNDPTTEIQIAMNEQNKITRIRLEKLIA